MIHITLLTGLQFIFASKYAAYYIAGLGVAFIAGAVVGMVILGACVAASREDQKMEAGHGAYRGQSCSRG